MEYVNSFSTTKAGKAYIVNVYNIHPDGDVMVFQVDSGASVSFMGLNSFCDPDKTDEYNILRDIVSDEIRNGHFERFKNSASTATQEEVELYPCKMDNVSISDTAPITLYFCLYLGNVSMPLLGFDYIDDCTYNHRIAGDIIFTAVAEDIGKRFYPDKVIDFNRVIDRFQMERRGG